MFVLPPLMHHLSVVSHRAGIGGGWGGEPRRCVEFGCCKEFLPNSGAQSMVDWAIYISIKYVDV